MSTPNLSVSSAPAVGLVQITFDAGGRGSSVDSNPQHTLLVDDDTLAITWLVTEVRNTLSEFALVVGNVVPCHLGELPDGYELDSEPIDSKGGLPPGWKWTLRRTDPNAPKAGDLPSGEILYDIFFTYLPKSTPIQSKSAPARRSPVSLRKILDVDPSLLLPPRKGDGAPTPDQD